VSQTINVTDPVPPAAAINGPASNSVYAVGTPITLKGVVSDNCGLQGAKWQIDAAVVPAGPIGPGGTVSTTYTFTQPGVYQIKLIAQDACGNTGTASTTTDGFDWTIIAYDPNGGFVTGGGWIQSVPGAYRPNLTLQGKANFGFVSKYQKGAKVPTGETEFDFKVGNLNFHSSSYEWLVVAGAKAQYKGVGDINGTGSYGFLLTGVDGDLIGGSQPDRFRIKIWDKVSGTIVYDNQYGQAEDSDASTALGGGSIVVHSDKSTFTAGASRAVVPLTAMGAQLEFALHAAYPNPFAGSTEIGFDLPEASRVSLSVFDVRGRRVAMLADDVFDPGTHSVTWRGRSDGGTQLETGVYFVRFAAHSLTTDHGLETVRKLILGR
jgi:hypothetical protein